MEKRLAVHLFGALRTYKQTYKSFFNNIIDINKQDGWLIDIFLHTWDQFDTGSAHSHLKYSGLTGVKIGIHDIEEIIGIYQPKKHLIESPILNSNKPGMYITLEKVNSLKLDYEKECNIKYDYHLYTRPDIMFFKPLRLDDYIKVYNPIRKPQNGWEGVFREFPLPPKTNFCSSNAFRFGLLDSRMPNEGDLVWFSNFGSVRHPHRAYLEDESIYNIFIKYRWEYEFRPWRSGMQQIDQYMFIDIKKSDLDGLNQHILTLNQEKLSLQKGLNSLTIKKQKMELVYLEQGIKIKNLKLYQLRKKNGLRIKDDIIYPNSAKFIIRNHLTYKVGRILIKYNSFFGYIKLPFILLAILIVHKTADFKYKTLPLKNYIDYNEAMIEKNGAIYQLGKKFIKACKSWYKGGLIKFFFEILTKK
ncbi:hypothetical protein ACOTV8_08330 [Campylobacter jejuni]